MSSSAHHINLRPSKRILARASTLAVSAIAFVFLFSHIAAADEALGTPHINSPVNDGWSNSTQVALAWQPVEHATAYGVQLVKADVCTATAFDAPAVVHSATVVEPTYTVAVDNGAYCWRVQAIGEANITSDWASPATFKVDTVAPVVAVSPLADGATTLTGTVDTAGVTLTALIDGKETAEQFSISLTPNESGLYAWSLPLAGLDSGDYSVVIRAVDAAGNQSLSAPQAVVIPEQIIKVSQAETAAAMLPLIDTGPLIVAITPTETPSTSESLMTPPSYTEVAQTTPDSASPAVLGAQTAAALDSSSPVQASTSGWLLFGIPLYMWAVVAIAVAASWWAIMRIRLRQRLARGLNVSNPVY